MVNWSIIKKIIDCKQFPRNSKLPFELSVDNEMINTNSQIFLDILCNYFVTTLELLCQRIFQTKTVLFLKFIKNAAYSLLLFKKSMKRRLIFALITSKSTKHQDQMEFLLGL